MGLSRNKVAVSEGAAGSPPFYGENVKARRALTIEKSLRISPPAILAERIAYRSRFFITKDDEIEVRQY